MFERIRRLALVLLGLVLFPASSGQAQNNIQRLNYDWPPGKANTYDVVFVETIDGQKSTTRGKLTFELKQKNVTTGFDGKRFDAAESEESTSTAFLISDDGYFLTCEHCVRHAKTIKLTLGDISFDAKVVDADANHDLALLKADASKLPKNVKPLKVSVGRPVRLAQDVRAIGFPLSNLLGSSVKIVRGGIAGFIGGKQNDSATADSYQIDAAVNPGNSGGPLVDQAGSVIGVVNAKLQSDAIDKVGFAIPVRIAVELLKKNQVEFLVSKNQDAVPGPELADRVVPAVAFVQAKSNPFLTDNLLIACVGKWTRDGVPKSIKGRTIVSKNGDVIDHEKMPWFPAMMQPASNALFVEMPEFRLPKWKDASLFGLELPEQRDDFGAGRFGFGADPFGLGAMGRMHDQMRRFNRGLGVPRGFGRFGGMPGLDPFGRDEPEQKSGPRKLVSLIERSYEVLPSIDPDKISIKRVSKMSPLSPGKNRLEQDCESVWTFDVVSGLPISRTAKGETRVHVDGAKLTVPFELTITLEGSKQVNVVDRKDDADEVKPPNVFANLPSEKIDSLSEEQLKQFVDEQSKLDTVTTLKFLNRLTRMSPDDGAEEVVAAIDRRTNSENRQIRKVAIDAMLHWSPEAAADSIIKELDAANSLSKRAWISKLGKTKSVKAAKVLCELLGSSRLQKTAGKAIGQMGDVAESALVDQIIADLKSASASETVSKTLDVKLGYLFKLAQPVVSGASKERLRAIGAMPTLSESSSAAWDKLAK